MAKPDPRNTILSRLYQIDLCIKLMDNAFRDLADVLDDEHPLFKDYQAMIMGARRTKAAQMRMLKALGVTL